MDRVGQQGEAIGIETAGQLGDEIDRSDRQHDAEPPSIGDQFSMRMLFCHDLPCRYARNRRRRRATILELRISYVTGLFVGDQGAAVDWLQSLATTQRGEFNHERATEDLAAELAHEMDRRQGGASGRKQVVDDQYP